MRSAMIKQRSHAMMQAQQQQMQQQGGPAAKRARMDGGVMMPPQTQVKGTVGTKRPGGEGTSLIECFSPEEVRTHLA